MCVTQRSHKTFHYCYIKIVRPLCTKWLICVPEQSHPGKCPTIPFSGTTHTQLTVPIKLWIHSSSVKGIRIGSLPKWHCQTWRVCVSVFSTKIYWMGVADTMCEPGLYSVQVKWTQWYFYRGVYRISGVLKKDFYKNCKIIVIVRGRGWWGGKPFLCPSL